MAERTYVIPAGAERTTVLGAADRNLKIIREALGVNIHARNGEVIVRGDEPAVGRATVVLEQLGHAALGRRSLGRDEVLAAIMDSPDSAADLDPALADGVADRPAWTGNLNVSAAGRPVRARTENQQAYVEAIRAHDLVFGIGPAGTGKTYLAVAAAVHMLRVGRVKKIILARPAVEAGERLGFLPGDLHQKVNPYLRPLFDALEDMLDFATLQRFTASDVVEVVPLAFMRGRTLNNCVIILDEAQNSTVSQMLMFLTRMGLRSKCIVTGDVSQIDLEDPRTSGLVDAARRLQRIPDVAFVSFNQSDIVRHRLVQRIVEAYGDKTRNHRSSAAASTSPDSPTRTSTTPNRRSRRTDTSTSA